MIRGKNKHLKFISPEISLRSAYTSFYIHNGQVYPIVGSSSETFRDAVYAHAGNQWDKTACKLLEAPDIDLVARWFILNRLVELKKPMELFQSQAEAETDIHSRVRL